MATGRAVRLVSVPDQANPMDQNDRKLLREALEVAAERFAALPNRLRLRFLTGLVTSYAMNQPDAISAFLLVVGESRGALERAMEIDRERGGHA